MWAFLQHFLTPHHTNNHRPKALHLESFIFYIAFFLFLQVNITNLKLMIPNILGLATDINVEKLLNLTNQKRLEQGLAPLDLDPQLSQAAAGKANDMFVKDYWAHNSPDGTTPWVFIKNAGYSYFYAGENLAKNFVNSEGVVDAWMVSSSHRQNLLKPEYQDVGFAVVNGRLGGEETTLVVQMFGAKQSAQVAVNPAVSSVVQKSSPPLPKVTLRPSPTLTPQPPPLVEVAPVILSSAKNQPLINAFSLSKAFSLGLIGFLIFVLTLDGLLIWRRKTVRLSGHNFAHIFFLISILGVVIISHPGVIH